MTLEQQIEELNNKTTEELEKLSGCKLTRQEMVSIIIYDILNKEEQTK